MKIILLNLSVVIALLLAVESGAIAQVGISTDNSTPDNSAILDLKSTSKGLLIPRMTQSQISAITTPANGLVVFCTTNDKFYAYVASASVWKEVLYGSGTIASFPTVTTTAVTDIAQTTATSGGNVTSDGGATVTLRGVCWEIYPNPTTADYKTTDGSGTGVFVSNLTGLTANTLYYVRAYAQNSAGIGYGNELTFTTLPNPVIPTVTTTAVTDITQTTATSGGNITSDGGATVTLRGVCWNTYPNPTTADYKTTDGSGTGVFVSNLTGLTANTFYYVRAYAQNSAGIAYGSELTFTTLSFAIGQSYGGGIIFYLDGTGNHGLISATNDQSTGAPWGCLGTSIPGTSTAIGTGQANTTLIVNGCTTSGIAAQICNDLVLNGYSDWFLPSKDELNQMYLQKSVIGGFATYYYWSSSEYDAVNAWGQNFNYGAQGVFHKNDTFYVRAVRAF